MTIDVTQV